MERHQNRGLAELVDAIGEVGYNKCTWLGCYITGSNPVSST